MNTAKKLDLKKLSQVTAVAINKTPADQDIDLDDLDSAYEQDLDQESYQNDSQAENAQQSLQQPQQPQPTI